MSVTQVAGRAGDPLADSPDGRFRELAADAVVTADRDGRITGWNPAAVELFGHEVAEILGAPLVRLVPPRFREAHEAAFRRAAGGARTGPLRRIVQLAGLRRDGSEFPLELSLSALGDGPGRSFLAIIRDVTERRRAEEERERLLAAERAARAEAQAAVEARERIMAVVSHDLRQPLSVIVGHAAMLLQYGELASKERRQVEAIERNAGRAARMIRDLVDYHRVRAAGAMDLVREAADLGRIAREAASAAGALKAARPVRVETSGDCAGELDADRMHRVVANLVGNALQHGQGPVTVRVEGGGADGQLTLAVHSGGEGIPADVLPTLFEAFRQGPGGARASAGLGLGLYIVREIARAHGGDVVATSTAAEGTTFTVRIPARPPGAPGP